jgi:DNA-binding transcriptional LysR family regulator
MSEPFVCCLPSGHPSAGASAVDLRSLANEPFVLFPREVSPYYHDVITSLCVEAGFSPLIRHELTQWLTIVGLVGRGMGVALVPRAMMHAHFGDVAYVPLAQSNILSEILGIWSGDWTGSTVDPFVAVLANVVSRLPAGALPRS